MYKAQIRIHNGNEYYQLMRYLDSSGYVWGDTNKLLQMNVSPNPDIIRINYNVVISIDNNGYVYWGTYHEDYYAKEDLISIQQLKEIIY